MSREIKFKVFHNGIMKPVHDMDFNVEMLTTETNDGKDEVILYFGGGENTPLQYTGRKDKNGVEIYEGDIVRKHCATDYKNTGPGSCKEIPIYRNYIYKWEGLGFKKECLGVEPKGYYETGGTKEEEIIGNIYETPNLLNN